MSLLDDLRRPEHTGDRRCWPCTVVNVALVALAAIVTGRKRKGLGLLVGVVGLALVALRGYVVPGTPTIAPKLVAASPLPDAWFHDEPPAAGITQGPAVDRGGEPDETPATEETPDDASEDRETPDPEQAGGLADEDAPDGEELLGVLVEAGVVTVEGEALELAPAFAEAWEARMDELAAQDIEALADAVREVAHAAKVTAFSNEEGAWVICADGSDTFEGETWLTRPVAIAEAAAVDALSEWLDDPALRRAAAGPLRMFLVDCPDCGTELVEATTASCCGGYTRTSEVPEDVLSCPECQRWVYVFEE
ncbi:hypothetical protein [Natronomonas sp. EA1]|uniref:hypothetical protein n=1 Tax=Natronomonas sp. EA1 TaxID=3421655 RepID=UPI003EBA6AD2